MSPPAFTCRRSRNRCALRLQRDHLPFRARSHLPSRRKRDLPGPAASYRELPGEKSIPRSPEHSPIRVNQCPSPYPKNFGLFWLNFLFRLAALHKFTNPSIHRTAPGTLLCAIAKNSPKSLKYLLHHPVPLLYSALRLPFGSKPGKIFTRNADN